MVVDVYHGNIIGFYEVKIVTLHYGKHLTPDTLIILSAYSQSQQRVADPSPI